MTLLLIGCLACALSAEAEESDQPKRILFMGNSYTFLYDLPQYVRMLAVADGYANPLIVVDVLGGEDVHYHLQQVLDQPQNNVLHPDIVGQEYDAVVLQPHGEESLDINQPNTYFIPTTINWSQAVRSAQSTASADIVFFQTWAHGPDHPFYPDTFTDAFAMHDEVRGNIARAKALTNLALNENVVRVAPVGDAFAALSFVPELYLFDNFHQSVLGSRLAAMIIYRSLYREDIADIHYSAINELLLSASQWNAANKLASSILIDEYYDDADQDGVSDLTDNCILNSNFDQRDSDADGFGNACDADLNGDCIVNFLDVSLFSNAFLSSDDDSDFNGDGIVNFLDFSFITSTFSSSPGPSALATCL